MKALTLWQPWASLVALGVKSIETRSWSTSYRGPLAVHAAKRAVRPGERVGDYKAVQDADYPRFVPPFLVRWPGRGPLDPKEPWRVIPLGAVVATCTLVDVVPTERGWWCDPAQWGDNDEDEEYLRSVGWGRDGDGHWFGTDQRDYGDFAPGRYAWLLTDIEPLVEPVPAKGRQGLWEWPADRRASAL